METDTAMMIFPLSMKNMLFFMTASNADSTKSYIPTYTHTISIISCSFTTYIPWAHMIWTHMDLCPPLTSSTTLMDPRTLIVVHLKRFWYPWLSTYTSTQEIQGVELVRSRCIRGSTICTAIWDTTLWWYFTIGKWTKWKYTRRKWHTRNQSTFMLRLWTGLSQVMDLSQSLVEGIQVFTCPWMPWSLWQY